MGVGCCYHILNHGNARQRMFHDDADFQSFIDLQAEARERFPAKDFAYCLMPNHFHLLMRAVRGEDLSRLMQQFTTTPVRRTHRRYDRSGHVWQGRFKSFPVQEDDHQLAVARYVEGNPSRARLATRAVKWPGRPSGKIMAWPSALTMAMTISSHDGRAAFFDEPLPLMSFLF